MARDRWAWIVLIVALIVIGLLERGRDRTVATVTLRPTATAVSDANSDPVGAATKHEAIDEAVLDVNDYVENRLQFGDPEPQQTRDYFTMDDPGPLSGATVSSVMLSSYAADQADGPDGVHRHSVRIGGTNYAVGSLTFNGSTPALKTDTLATSPATGTAWTWDEIRTAKFGFYMGTKNAGQEDIWVRFYQLWVVVTYTRDNSKHQKPIQSRLGYFIRDPWRRWR